jgi:ATP-dependent DNA helicase DinG
VRELLERVTATLPGGGERREQQYRMAEAVAEAIERHRHLVVEAGTGTGKSLAYLLPVVVAGRRCVVATATKALQDQLANKDLPFLRERFPALRFAVLKGRANYLCVERIREQELDDGLSSSSSSEQAASIYAWAARTETGDRAELSFEPEARLWRAFSVDADECLGRMRCPSGEACFAEAARDRAAAADIVVVNAHLYAAHLASGGSVLPEHDLVVFDEAHELEDVMAEGLGTTVTAGKLHRVARLARSLVGEPAERLDEAAAALRHELDARRETRGCPAAVETCLVRAEALAAALRRVDEPSIRLDRALLAADHAVEALRSVATPGPDDVVYVDADGALKVAPVAVGSLLRGRLWGSVTAVLASATIPPELPERLGLPAGSYEELRVGSPFDYANRALLYCGTHLPNPGPGELPSQVLEELLALIEAAGGRTLALFTSWRRMRQAVAFARERLAYPVWSQDDLPKPLLVQRFTEDVASCLFATLSFWQGVDVPGEALSLVVIDRLPFDRPDDPLFEARKERAGTAWFAKLALPRAATLLAQGAGRLIRTADDRGVVAVLDPRLAIRPYGKQLRQALPPMTFTTRLEDVRAFFSTRAAPPAPAAAASSSPPRP